MRITEARKRLWRWIEADPKNVALLMLPLTVADLVDQARWLRAHDMSAFSVRGAFAYIRARPGRAALSVVVALLPDIVAAVLRRRSPGQGAPRQDAEQQDDQQQEGPAGHGAS